MWALTLLDNFPSVSQSVSVVSNLGATFLVL